MAALAMASATAAAARQESTPEERFYVCAPYIFHPALANSQLASLFDSCRQRGIAFDMRCCQGTAIQLVDSLAFGTLGLMSVGRSPLHSAQLLRAAAVFLSAQVKQKPTQPEYAGFEREANLGRVLACAKRMVKTLKLSTTRPASGSASTRKPRTPEKPSSARATATTTATSGEMKTPSKTEQKRPESGKRPGSGKASARASQPQSGPGAVAGGGAGKPEKGSLKKPETGSLRDRRPGAPAAPSPAFALTATSGPVSPSPSPSPGTGTGTATSFSSAAIALPKRAPPPPPSVAS